MGRLRLTCQRHFSEIYAQEMPTETRSTGARLCYVDRVQDIAPGLAVSKLQWIGYQPSSYQPAMLLAGGGCAAQATPPFGGAICLGTA